MTKILFSENFEETEKTNVNLEEKTKVKPETGKNKTINKSNTAEFPEWDIIPPNQIINPRIKQKL